MENHTIDTRIKELFFKESSNYVRNSYLDYLIIIGDAIAGDIDKYHDKQRIIKVFDYQVNQERDREVGYNDEDSQFYLYYGSCSS